MTDKTTIIDDRRPYDESEIKRDKKGRWEKGSSGNPRGQPKSNLQSIAKAAIKDQLPILVEKIVEQAKEGCVKSQEMLLNKVLPNMKSKDMPLDVIMPEVKSADIESLLVAMTDVLNHALESKITNSQAESLMKQMESVRSTYEAEHVQKQLEELKEAIQK